MVQNNLQALRWERELTQRQLSKLSGVSRETICKIEDGERLNPSVQTALLLSHALGVTVEELFYLREGST